MRLSLKKAAYVAVDESNVVGNPEFARDDKGWSGASMGNWLAAERVAGPEASYPTQAKTGLEWGTPASVAGAEGGESQVR